MSDDDVERRFLLTLAPNIQENYSHWKEKKNNWLPCNDWLGDNEGRDSHPVYGKILLQAVKLNLIVIVYKHWYFDLLQTIHVSF